ncbi:hypothetical protein GQX73_g1746 [Xylaria multiplex]|uniref:Major facilitator superfamily (MFS) profile domain-containing protein n=1 Tax=Xylaria multiplex TaxID=323545 RepID=A0A7C8J062_9PEZI|nr:hypothetical protein GQX73_g1746 [Xylaria multiplex]
MSDFEIQMSGEGATGPEDSAKEEQATEIAPKVGEYPKGVRLALIVTALALSIFLSALDITIVATAIPKITDEFHGLDKASWYGSAFFLTSGSFQASWGKAYKYFDIKWTFLSAIVVFELGSLLCAVAPNSNALIVGRAIAGAGSAGMTPGGYIIIAYVVEPVKRPTYTGIIGLSYCLASVVGPLVGGAITTTTTWKWCFYINLPVGAVTVFIVLFFFRTSSIVKPITATWTEKFLQADFVGVALILGALVSYSLATQYGGKTEAWNSSTIIGLLVGFVLLVAVFAAWEWHAGERAMIVPRLLMQRHVATGSLFAFFFAGSYFLTIYYLPIYFQTVDGASPIISGVDTLPLIIASAVAVISAGLFISKTGYAVPVQVASAIITTVGAGLLLTLNLGTPTGNWIGYQIIAALGWGAGFQIPVTICQALAKPTDIPSLTAIILFFLNIGGGLLINGAQSALVNTLISTLPTSAPDVDPSLLISTGALEIRSVFPEEQIPGILEAYMKVLITGCSDGGIGSELAKQFAARGYQVYATVRTPSKAASLVGVSGVEVLELEVTSTESIAACATEVDRCTGGTLDVLINNAGADFVVPFLDVSLEQAKQLYDVNVFSIIGVTQEFAPMLIKAQGCVVNFSSIAGVYSSSKAAAKQISECMRTELAPLGVRVITGIIGAVQTPIHQRAGDLVLSEGSYYQNLRDHINEVRKGTTKPGAVDVASVCKTIVSDVDGEKRGIVWRGGTAAAVRFLSWLLPNGLWESVVNKGRGLEQVVKPAEK